MKGPLEGPSESPLENRECRPGAQAAESCRAALWTTVLACLWGAGAAYLLFNSLLVTHINRFACAALILLIAVWATLERKRWGRLALMGLSITTVTLSAALLGVFMVCGPRLQPEAMTTGNYIQLLLSSYGISGKGAVSLLVLAAATGLWLGRPEVAAEFNKNKRQTLAIAQRGIAAALVGCWSVFMAFTPLLSDSRDGGMTSKRPGYAAPRSHSAAPARRSAPPVAVSRR